MGAIIVALSGAVYWLSSRLLDALEKRITESRENGRLAEQVAAALREQAAINRLLASKGGSN